MLKLLIADSSNALAVALHRRLQDRYEIYRCNSSDTARELVDTIHPDILIIHLSLEPRGGFWVLQNAGFAPSVMIALTDYVSDDVLQTAAGLGFQDVIRIPCTVRHIISHMELLTDKKAPSQGH